VRGEPPRPFTEKGEEDGEHTDGEDQLLQGVGERIYPGFLGVRGPDDGEGRDAPSVTKVSPAEKATGVSQKASVAAFFSEAMDPSTINASTVKLRKAGTLRKVAATISYDPTNKKAILNPRANLIHGAAYTVTVSTGVKYEAGNLLDQDPSLAGNQSKVWRIKVQN
jgi:hypothetical protein